MSRAKEATDFQRRTQEQKQGRQPHALRLQPPLRPELPGGGAARGRRTGAAAGGLCASHPQARRCRRAAARVPALAPASLPREETKGRFSRVTARPLTGKQSRPLRGRPPHKGAPRLGTRAAGGACGSRAARAGRGGPEGREGGRKAAGGAGTEGKRRGEGARRATDRGAGRGAGAPAWLGRPARAAPCAPSSARPARSAAGGQGAGLGRAGAGPAGGAGARTWGSSRHRKRAVVGETHRKCVTTPPTARTKLAVVAARRRCRPSLLLHTRAHAAAGTLPLEVWSNRSSARTSSVSAAPTGVEPAIPAMVRGSVQHRPLLHVPGPRSPMPPGALCTSTEMQGADRTYTVREASNHDEVPCRTN
nr:translation initiation factor IF-2-like [Macaca fascicularis]